MKDINQVLEYLNNEIDNHSECTDITCVERKEFSQELIDFIKSEPEQEFQGIADEALESIAHKKYIETKNGMKENFAENALKQFGCSIEELELCEQNTFDGYIWFFRKKEPEQKPDQPNSCQCNGNKAWLVLRSLAKFQGSGNLTFDVLSSNLRRVLSEQEIK